MLRAQNIIHNRSPKRQLILKVIEGENAIKSTTGMVDPRLFKNENELYAIMDPSTTFWHLQYKRGHIPEPLHQQWTTFGKLMDFTREYFKRRNVEITEVKDIVDAP